jgi:hypothetical protein
VAEFWKPTGLVIFAVAGTLGAIVTSLLDGTNSPVAWFFSFLIKWAQSPLTTTVGLIAATVVAMSGGKADVRRGFTYLTVGAPWSVVQGGAWNDLDGAGCGNPFEKHAHPFTNDPSTAVSASSC